MSLMSGKHIILGVTGGIAAYKTTYLTRLLIKAGATVKVVMTNAAKEFVTALTLSTLSKNEVLSDFTDPDDPNKRWNNHVELGLWADLIIIAPATANTLSKMANGHTDSFLLAVYSSAKCPVFFAPAMDLDMYLHPSTQDNFKRLQSFGNTMIPAAHGELASGLVGQGRMAEPEDIVEFLMTDLRQKLPLLHKKALVTAGPTYEAIDPVRFIGNHSSGKMGAAIALELANQGAEVTLVMGPSVVKSDHDHIHRVNVISAEEMYQAVHACIDEVDVAIFSAAVADYRPKNIASSKIKKKTDTLSIELVKTKDILASVGALPNKPLTVGFALETNDELTNAIGKLERKNADLLVLNSLRDKGAGFKGDTNKITLVRKDKTTKEFELKSKSAVAKDIIDEVLLLIPS